VQIQLRPGALLLGEEKTAPPPAPQLPAPAPKPLAQPTAKRMAPPPGFEHVPVSSGALLLFPLIQWTVIQTLGCLKGKTSGVNPRG